VPLPQRPLGSSGVLITRIWRLRNRRRRLGIWLGTTGRRRFAGEHASRTGARGELDRYGCSVRARPFRRSGRPPAERTDAIRAPQWVFAKCASLRRERFLASRVLASCFVLPVEAASLTGANKIALSSRAHPHARPTAPLKTLHGLDGRQREIRRLAYLMTMMTTDQMIGKARGHWAWFAGIVVLAAAAAAGLSHRVPSNSRSVRPAPPAIRVTVAPVKTRDVPIYLSAPGTVLAWNTVAVRSQLDGKLTAVNFVEGQDVRAGDVLAQTDTSTLQATLNQVVAKKAADEAQLAEAAKELERDQVLVQRQAIPQQTLDQQQAKVGQLRAAVDADQAAIDSARVQLGYASITAQIDGRVGRRQLDVGNIIHTNDPNPLTVLTLIRPSATTFTLPQKNLFDVREAMRRGPVTTIAFDQDDKQELSQGQLLFVDNQIDPSTGSVLLKARFANDDERLWPGEFVRIRMLVDTRKNALTIPSLALQRGPEGFYVWVVQPDNTAQPRDVDAKPIDENLTIVDKGLSPDERVVVNGQSRLEAGARVEPRSEQPG
jgi:membrane fusion protein, multidrug efflux system